MIELTEAQIEDLIALQQICDELRCDLVIVGAIAYQYHFPGEDRHTSDIDTVVALDLEDFDVLKRRLRALGWVNLEKREHRWESPCGTFLDLIPAGENLRRAGSVTWPQSQFKMSLVGFDQVFSRAQQVSIGNHLQIRVITPKVLMLLKIVAFLDDQTRRAKDLPDIRALMSVYEADSDRIFSDAVLDANLADFSLANAYLLGLDLRTICTDEDVAVVRRFLSIVSDDTRPAWLAFVRAAARGSEQTEEIARSVISAFQQGFEAETISS